MHIPVLIGGGGIIGLLFYYEIQKQFPQLDCALLEGSSFFGDHATGRNSGVLHAGLYYPYDSLKREMCLRGNYMWTDLAKELDVSVNRCGKYIVAASRSDNIDNLFEKAKANGVTGLRWSTKEEQEQLSQWCYHEKSFFSETTGFLSPSEVTKSLTNNIEKKGGILMRDHKVLSLIKKDKIIVETNHGEFSCDYFINAAGGFAPELRRSLGLNDIESVWVKGNYLKYKKDFYNDSLIYPVPAPNLKGLGIHTSFDQDGIVRFGPNTEDVFQYEYSMNSECFNEMAKGIHQTFKSVDEEALSLDYCGIRPKIKKSGKLYQDFYLNAPREIPGYLEYLGIESPGLTAAPALIERGIKLLKIGS